MTDDPTAKVDWERVKEGASELGVPSNTFQQWKSRGVIPHRWRLPLIELGKVSAVAFKSSDKRRKIA